MQRIVILGVTGSGKTTFGKKLAATLGLPVTDLDELHWLPGWQQRPVPEFYALTAERAAGNAWVVIGNYSKVRDAVWPRADAFIWLDYPFPRVFWQLLKRSIMRAIDKNPICNGNIESWKQMFSKDSIMVWLFTSYSRRRREYGAIFDSAGNSPQAAYIRLKSHREADAFLEQIKRA